MSASPPDPWVVILARDPLRAKSRLASALRPPERALLARAMLEDVLSAVRRARGRARVLVATESATVADLAAAHGAEALPVPPRGSRGAAHVALRALSGAPAVLILPADLPCIRASDVSRAIAASARADIVVVPDRHLRGTNALLLRPPHAIAPRFGPRSYPAHRAAARRSGRSWRSLAFPGLRFDLDTPEDLRLLLARRRRAAPATAAALRRLRQDAPSSKRTISLRGRRPRGRGTDSA